MKKLLLLTSLMCVAALPKAQITFNYTGSQQFYVVPGCVDSVMVDVMAAEGGTGPVGCTSATFESGGKGGRVQATIPVSTGDTLFIFVGGKGENDDFFSAVGGYNGGGDAALENQYNFYGGGGGGGASDIRLNATTLNDRIIVAGGGGGAGSDGCDCNDLFGGAGGGLTGEGGEPGIICLCNPSGQGGTQSAGGPKGDWACTCDAQDGSLGQGGMSNTTSCGGPTGGGGGGGGYYGGGGGGLGAGGGGSSFAFSSAINVIHTQGYQTGNGLVIITPNGGLTLSATVIPNDSVCEGAQITLSGSGADSYFWNNGVVDGVPFKVFATTTYTLTGINANECTDTLHVTIFVFPPTPVTLTIPEPDTLCSFGGSVTLSGSPSGGVFSGAGVSGNSFDPQNAVNEAWNVITYSVIDLNGCTSETQDSLFVTTCVALENIAAANQQIKLFPNPGNGEFTIETSAIGDLIIYNVLGEVIWKQTLQTGNNKLDIKKQPAGIYAVKFIGKGVQVIELVKN